ncbi:transglutaminase-like domain-containing protein [Microbacterium sp.]|uniref:transglutaminase-like domain-containing protein n=1 Tax=Microbacterium sp. TaxID=51671 RepID=UPI003C15317B
MSAKTAEPTFTEVTRYLDWDQPAVQEFTAEAIGDATDPVEKASRIFVAVRDSIWYDPYMIPAADGDFRASVVATTTRAYCVPKAVLLTAAARAAGIPARLGFADVRNHLQTDTLREKMQGSDLFPWHGYTEMLIDGRWVKATPAFNAELCARFGVEPLEFDGVHDALLHPFSGDGSEYMEYVQDHGWFAELPLDRILASYEGFRFDDSDTVVDEKFA